MKQTVFFFILLSLPVVVLGRWSEPGADFSGELNLSGQVTSTRNPWVWRIADSLPEIHLNTSSSVRKGRENEWHPENDTLPLVIGKTVFTSPSGRNGLAPVVVFSPQLYGGEVSWESDGTARIRIPLRDVDNKDGSIFGYITFKLKAWAVSHYSEGGFEKVSLLYNDLPANGLPDKYISTGLGDVRYLFGADMPAWLTGLRNATDIKPLSSLNSSSLYNIDAAYAAGIVAGSLRVYSLGNEMPSVWSGRFPVKIEYH